MTHAVSVLIEGPLSMRRIVLLALCCLLASCGGDDQPSWPADAGPERPLRLVVVRPASQVGVDHVIRVHEPLLMAVGVTTGLTFKQPLVVESPIEARLALAEGRADLGLLGPFTFADALAEEQVHWIARCVREEDAVELVLIVAQNARYKTPGDLRGRTIGIVGLEDRPAEADPFLLISDELLEDAATRLQVFAREVPVLIGLAEGALEAAVLERSTWDRVVADELFSSTTFRELAAIKVPLGGAVVAARDLPGSVRRQLASGFGVLHEVEQVEAGVLLGPGQVRVSHYATGSIVQVAHEALATELKAAGARRLRGLNPMRGR